MKNEVNWNMKQEDINRVQEIAEELAPELKKLALDIHGNPELGNEEYRACQWQTDLLQKYGFTVEANFCDIPTAYRAVYDGRNERKDGPKIAMLAEYDALPELGHGCGHNLIAMMSVGSGIAIREFADLYGGEITVIGTPAEETAGAKVEMARRNAFREYDVVMMAHPFQKNGSSINTMAMYCRSFEFFGKTAHAANAPYEGLNALDAVINFFNMVNALRQQTRDDARIHGIIADGGTAPNIIPDYTRALFYIRANKAAYVEELLAKMTACAEGAALGTGTTVKVSAAEDDFKDTDSNMALSELACQQMEKLGHTMERHGKRVLAGSSDLGDVSYQCPAIQLMCGMGKEDGEEDYVPHTTEFAAHACSAKALENALDFVKGFTMTAIELMTEPKHLAEIKEEFAKIG